MKTTTKFFTLFSILLITASLASGYSQPRQKKSGDRKGSENQKTENISLFNGRDLSNWVLYLKDKSVDPATVFTVRDGVIHVTGTPFGYMRTRETYSDYRLHVEWRWPLEPTNSGVFIHAQTPDTIWIKTFECQLAAGNAGDLICMNGTDMNEHKDKSTIVIKKLNPSSEKKPGEWNTMEVLCRANTLEVYINGVLQNKGTGLSVNHGHICLQSEGKDIEFRNVNITPLRKSQHR